MNDDYEERIRSGQALSESMGNFHVTEWESEGKRLKAAFNVRRGKRVAFVQAVLYNPEGKLAAEATSTGVLAGL